MARGPRTPERPRKHQENKDGRGSKENQRNCKIICPSPPEATRQRARLLSMRPTLGFFLEI